MKKVLAVLFTFAVASALTMPVFAQDAGSGSTDSSAKTSKKHHKKSSKKSKKGSSDSSTPSK